MFLTKAQLQLWLDNSRLAIAGLGAFALNTLLKNLFERARPALWARVVDVSLSSFPSGHAMLSIVAYDFFGYFLATRYLKKQGWIMGFATLLIILTLADCILVCTS